MKSSLENAALFYLPALDAYEELRMRAFPEMDSDAEDSDFDNLVSPESLLDDGYEVFLVESGKDAKLICGSNKGNSSDVFEFVLKCGEFQMVVRRLQRGGKRVEQIRQRRHDMSSDGGNHNDYRCKNSVFSGRAFRKKDLLA